MNAGRMEAAAGLIDQVKTAGGSLALYGDKLKALSVPADLLPELRAHKAEIVQLLTPTAEGVGNADTMPRHGFPELTVQWTDCTGKVSGRIDDTVESLLRFVVAQWPGEVLAVWNDSKQIWPRPDQ